MGSMKKWMLGAAMVASAAALTAVPAQAARVGIYIGAPAAYVPPCPGPGYAWVDGFYANGYWNPGYWNYVGVGVRFGGPVYRGGYYVDHGRDWDRDRDWDHDRHFDRDRDRDFDRDRHYDRDDHFRR